MVGLGLVPWYIRPAGSNGGSAAAMSYGGRRLLAAPQQVRGIQTLADDGSFWPMAAQHAALLAPGDTVFNNVQSVSHG